MKIINVRILEIIVFLSTNKKSKISKRSVKLNNFRKRSKLILLIIVFFSTKKKKKKTIFFPKKNINKTKQFSQPFIQKQDKTESFQFKKSKTYERIDNTGWFPNNKIISKKKKYTLHKPYIVRTYANSLPKIRIVQERKRNGIL